jgi:hypothetical protein
MTPEQAAAFVQSQTACLMAEMASMHAENYERQLNNQTHAHDYASFAALPDEYGIGYNAVVSLFQNANQG